LAQVFSHFKKVSEKLGVEEFGIRVEESVFHIESQRLCYACHAAGFVALGTFGLKDLLYLMNVFGFSTRNSSHGSSRKRDHFKEIFPFKIG